MGRKGKDIMRYGDAFDGYSVGAEKAVEDFNREVNLSDIETLEDVEEAESKLDDLAETVGDLRAELEDELDNLKGSEDAVSKLSEALEDKRVEIEESIPKFAIGDIVYLKEGATAKMFKVVDLIENGEPDDETHIYMLRSCGPPTYWRSAKESKLKV